MNISESHYQCCYENGMRLRVRDQLQDRYQLVCNHASMVSWDTGGEITGTAIGRRWPHSTAMPGQADPTPQEGNLWKHGGHLNRQEGY